MRTEQKRQYERPQMMVVKLKHQGRLLSMSNPKDYENGGSGFTFP